MGFCGCDWVSTMCAVCDPLESESVSVGRGEFVGLALREGEQLPVRSDMSGTEWRCARRGGGEAYGL